MIQQKTKPMLLKYNIQSRLNKLTRAQHEKTMSKILKETGVSRATFMRWKKAEQNDKLEIPFSHQLSISKVFNCDILELSNQIKEKA
jgi:transcriptional regulator with XRE-family HTH domain